jgi:hypothetical protein
MSEKTIIAQLDHLLKPVGFLRQKAKWNRRVDSLVDVVDLQVSKAGDAITVNAGVLDTDVHAKLWGSAPPEFVDQPLCTVCARIGELIDGKDKWWRLSEDSAVTEVSHEVAAHVLPFFDRLHSREAMEKWLSDTEVASKQYPPPIIGLAVLKSLLGKGEEACALLAEIHKKPIGEWRTRIVEVSARLGCP